MTKKDLLLAAWFLDEFADGIFAGETVGGKWVRDTEEAIKAKAEYDECRALAKKLRAAAKG